MIKTRKLQLRSMVPSDSILSFLKFMHTREKEIELLNNYLKGDKKAAILLSQEAARLAVLVAEKYTYIGSDNFSRLVTAAYVGFWVGLESYVANKTFEKKFEGKPFKLTTYATYFMKTRVERSLKYSTK